MKSTLSVLMIVAAGIVRASGDAVSCSVIDYLYYSSDCCDGSNSVQCMESIPQTDKAAIDNLASLKRPEGAACESGDSIKFLNSKIVCTTADSCLIPCVNGNITGSVSTTCACACNAGFSGADCSTADPTTTPAPAGPSITLYEDGTGYSNTESDTLNAQECFDNENVILAALRTLKNDQAITFTDPFNDVSDMQAGGTHYGSEWKPKGCFVTVDAGQYRLAYNEHGIGSDPSAQYIGINLK